MRSIIVIKLESVRFSYTRLFRNYDLLLFSLVTSNRFGSSGALSRKKLPVKGSTLDANIVRWCRYYQVCVETILALKLLTVFGDRFTAIN